jgi:hypothetical protein
LRIEHEPNRATRKKLATKAFFALISKLDKENDQFYQSMLSDDTPCEGVDINNKPYSFLKGTRQWLRKKLKLKK